MYYQGFVIKYSCVVCINMIIMIRILYCVVRGVYVCDRFEVRYRNVVSILMNVRISTLTSTISEPGAVAESVQHWSRVREIMDSNPC